MYFALIRKVVLRDKFFFTLLNLSLFLLSFLFLITYYTINALQSVHFDAIRDVRSMDLRIDDASIISRDELEKIDGISGVFELSDLEVFSLANNSSFCIRFAPEELYEHPRFLSQFEFFSAPNGDEGASFSSFSDISPFSEYYYIKSSDSTKRAMIAKIDIVPNSYFYTKSPVLKNMGFMNMSKADELGLGHFYGIYTDNQKLAQKALRARGIEYRAHDEFTDTLITALRLEKYLFMASLFFIFAVLLILFFRLGLKFITENCKSISILSFLGLKDSKLFALFSLPMLFCSLFSCLLGYLLANVFSSSYWLRSRIFGLIFSQDFTLDLKSDIGFSYLYIFICVFFLLSLSLLLYAKVRRAEKVDDYE